MSIYANEKLLIVTEDAPPYSFLGDEGEVEGWATDHVRSILDNTSYQYDIKLMPWARAYNLAKTQANMLIYPIAYLDNRKDFFHFICPISKIPNYSFYRLSTRNDIEIKSLNDAKKYLIGVVRHDSVHMYFTKTGVINKENIDLAANDDITIKKLIHGRIDLIYTSQASIESRLRKNGFKIDRVKAIYQISDYKGKELCLALSKNSDINLVKQLKAAHQKLLNKNKVL